MNALAVSAWSSIGAGIAFLVVQVFHPEQAASEVSGAPWFHVHLWTMVMAVLGLIGTTGIWRHQRDRALWLGTIGYGLFVFWLISTIALVFVEWAVLPSLVSVAPQWVEGVLGLPEGRTSAVDLGTLPLVASLSGIAYMLGGFVFGIATFRAKVFSRIAALVFGIGAASAIVFSLLPHEFVRLAAVPVGVGWIALGASALSRLRAK